MAFQMNEDGTTTPWCNCSHSVLVPLCVHIVCCSMLKSWPLSDRRGSGSEEREDVRGWREKVMGGYGKKKCVCVCVIRENGWIVVLAGLILHLQGISSQLHPSPLLSAVILKHYIYDIDKRWSTVSRQNKLGKKDFAMVDLFGLWNWYFIDSLDPHFIFYNRSNSF